MGFYPQSEPTRLQKSKAVSAYAEFIAEGQCLGNKHFEEAFSNYEAAYGEIKEDSPIDTLIFAAIVLGIQIGER